MELELARRWWTVALRGVLAILLGVLAFLRPDAFWLAVAYTFGAFALIDGAIAIAAAITGRGLAERRWVLFLEGGLGIAAGVVTFLWPGITELALLCVIAAWFITTGMFEVVASVRSRHYIPAWWALTLSGVLSVILGLALAIVPLAGLVVLAWWAGASWIAFGVLLLVLAFRLRGLARHAPRSVGVTVP